MKKIRDVRMIEATEVYSQAKQIHNVAEAIMQACEQGVAIPPFARSRVAGFDLARDAAILGYLVLAYEQENK